MVKTKYNRELLTRLLIGELLIKETSWPDDWYCEFVRNKNWPAYDPQAAERIPWYDGAEELYHELEDLGWEGGELISGWDYVPPQDPPELVAFVTLWRPSALGRAYLLQLFDSSRAAEAAE
jgi:hypothetical protein